MSADPTDLDGFPEPPVYPVRVEGDWLTATDPESMLRHLRVRIEHTPDGRRKLRLFGCVCCRRMTRHFIQPSLAASEYLECIAFAEGYADGTGAKKRLGKIIASAENKFGRGSTNAVAAHCLCNENAWLAAYAYHDVGQRYRPEHQDNPAELAILLRCIFGNPFRPLTFDPRWRSETAVALASGIYEARAFDRLPILADALEEAGCDHHDILTHCREPNGLHARGCWVVDGVLGKA